MEGGCDLDHNHVSARGDLLSVDMEFSQHKSGAIWAETVVTFEGYQDKDYCAVAFLEERSQRVLGRGVARRTPHDKYDGEIARDLALGRALVNAGNRMLKRANGRVKHADDVRRGRGVPTIVIGAPGPLTPDQVDYLRREYEDLWKKQREREKGKKRGK